MTSDPEPPPAAYLPLSGGLFRDCLVHDFDAVRWVTGREVVEVYATGSDAGPAMFRAAGTCPRPPRSSPWTTARW